MILEFRQGFRNFSENLQTTLPESDMHAPVQRQMTTLDSATQGKVMKRTKTQMNMDLALERQNTTINPIMFSGKGFDNMKIVRHRTTDFDVWSVIPDKKSTTKPKSVHENSPLNLSRPMSEVSAYELEKKEGHKFPILGPTRQQTDIYFKHKSKKLQGLSLQGPPADQDTLRRYNSEYVIREDKHSEHLQSSRKLRSSWSNITSGSIISRKNKNHVIHGDTTDNLQDVRFFAELVKPLQYRLRTHEKEEKEKILFPSKYGFHQRSHSPTFRRLLEATEKLKIISQHETVKTLLKQNANINEKKVVSLIKPDPEIVKEKAELFDSVTPKTPDVTARTEKKKHTTFITDEVIDNKDNTTISDFPDNITTISEEPEVEDVSDIDSEDEDDEKEDHDNSFKVDFKVDDSHAELHLFLPKISSGNKSAKTNRTDDFDESSNKTDRTGPIVLPSIKVDSIHQIKSYQNPPGRKLKRQETFRKKKKKQLKG
ncbi:unnamed protein product [Mytilus edulis]|uniref:Uncharacterized protein n=1 Tax=Mytilus edulis TaxID=6550 RepID=A0A8S3TDH0_MYTED|nr:unnamed protein product [Mytilus edulis]